jgi:hypothetical protein
VMLFRPGMNNAHLDVVVDVAVVHVRRVFGKEHLGRLRTFDQVAVLVGRVGGNVNDLRRVADGPRRQEEVFVFTFSTVRHWADAETIRENFRADAARSVVDSEAVSDTLERV